MGTIKRHLTWVGEFERTPQREMQLAAQVESHWITPVSTISGDDEPVWRVVVDPLPGWLKPLWACDDEFLYLRRPEGAWKTRLPQDPLFRLMQPVEIHLAIRCANSGEPSGDILLGWQADAATGWRNGDQEVVSLTRLDEDRDPDFWIDPPAKADFLGSTPRKRADLSDASRLVIDLGEDAKAQPSFAFEEDWLYATDASNGQVLAYLLDDELDPQIRQALLEGRLAARYHGPFVGDFIVDVRVQAAGQ